MIEEKQTPFSIKTKLRRNSRKRNRLILNKNLVNKYIYNSKQNPDLKEAKRIILKSQDFQTTMNSKHKVIRFIIPQEKQTVTKKAYENPYLGLIQSLDFSDFKSNNRPKILPKLND